MAFKEQVTSVVHEILSDPLNLPAQFLDYIPQFVAQNPVALGAARAPMLIPTGTPGATAATRLVGATTAGAPTTGTFQEGDVVVDQNGTIWICTTTGSPGSWMQPGSPAARGSRTSSVSTTGTTFAAGADLLASALSVTADGTSRYMLEVFASTVSNNTAGDVYVLRLNLDGADAGQFAAGTSAVAGALHPLTALMDLGVLSAATHTINVRLIAGTGGTAIVNAGAGGAGVTTPLFVSVTRYA